MCVDRGAVPVVVAEAEMLCVAVGEVGMVMVGMGEGVPPRAPKEGVLDIVLQGLAVGLVVMVGAALAVRLAVAVLRSSRLGEAVLLRVGRPAEALGRAEVEGAGVSVAWEGEGEAVLAALADRLGLAE